MDQTKIAFALKARQLAAQAAQMADSLGSLADVYDHRGYGEGGADPISPADLDNSAVLPAGSGSLAGITPDKLYAFAIFCRQYQALMADQAVTQADYRATVDQIRNDL